MRSRNQRGPSYTCRDMVESAMRRGYGEPAARPRHPRVRPARATGTADVVGGRRRRGHRGRDQVVVRRRSPPVRSRPSCGRRASPSPSPRWPRPRSWRGDAAWDGLQPDALGPFSGWVTVVGEPQRTAGADRVVLVVDGERYEVWVRGRAGRQRVARWHAGDRVRVDGERRRARRPAADDASPGSTSSASSTSPGSATSAPGTPAAEASNRVRELIRRGAAALADRPGGAGPGPA